MPKPLVIVESPAKAKTISKFLGKDWVVEASIGHVRDLPHGASEVPEAIKNEAWSRLGVNVDEGYAPVYVVAKEKRGKIKELKALLKDASELYLATDEDREGEAISWHLLELLQPKVPVKRMVFHEITKSAIQEAVDNCREIDASLVDAQEARRILDRLYGYEVSPVLWKKVGPNTSAGRVQSVATRLLVERERERMAFRAASYWDAKVLLDREGVRFPAQVVAVDGKHLAQGKDFGLEGQLIPGRTVQVFDEARARRLAEGLNGAAATARKVEHKEYGSAPKPPFTTSTLQQEAGRKLGMSAKRAMGAAQSLYQNGYITYMRTDSVALSAQAIAAARSLVSGRYGTEYLPRTPREYSSKSRNAQEAHEAIRPAGESFRMPEEIAREVGEDEARLYELIWKRTVASQMVDARMKSVTAVFDAALPGGGRAELVARGRTVLFDGYQRAYVEGSDEPEPGEKREEEEAVLPPLSNGDVAKVARSEASGHVTKPPARFTEAGLVQKLEELQIGRPSTYASIIGTILDREYVIKRGPALVPTPLAFAVVNCMISLDPRLLDYGFTAEMEERLDEISRGELKRNEFLERFYRGAEPGIVSIVKRIDKLDPKSIGSIPIGEKDGQTILLRNGRYGPYLEVGELRASLPEGIAVDEITPERALELIATASQAEEPMGHAPSGEPVYLRTGRFGPYVQLGEDPEDKTGPKPKRASLLKSMSPKTLTLEQALQLLTLPRELGQDVDGIPIRANLGRFGPYLMKEVPGAEKPDYRNLKTEDQLFGITLEEARVIYSQPKGFRRGRGASAAPLRELGVDPASGTPVVIKDGKYGPYCTDGTTNASLPKDAKVEEFTLEAAARLLAERREKEPVKKKRGGKTAAKSGPSNANSSANSKANSKAKSGAKSTSKSAKAAKQPDDE
jgi:DNA topoisomerase-1